jgi:hypothetical protein
MKRQAHSPPHAGSIAIMVIATLTGWTLTSSARGDLAIETETARLLPQGHFQFSAAAEFQTSSEGQEYALPLALEYGILDRLEVLFEPVPVTSIQPKHASSATGIGDTELTVTYLALRERNTIPAIALAGEIKIPTARNSQIGSKEFDYRVYGIVSKRFGDVDLHFNVGYNIVGAPSGVSTKNPIDLAVAAEWLVDKRFDLFGEITYIGASLRGGGAGEVPDAGSAGLTHEISGEETVGSLGIRYHVNSDVDVFGSISYDNNDAILFRTGFSWRI